MGGLRTALYNYLFARKHGGTFVLRIEDTDRSRYVEDAVTNLLETLRWSGLEFDEGPAKGGEHGPYVQSERLPLYRRFAEELVAKGNAYYAFDTAEELEQMRKDREKLRLPPKYDRRALKLSAEEVRRNLASGIPYVLRMRTPDNEQIGFDDVVRGRVEFDSSVIDDQVLLKSDGYPTYHLANVVDDHTMGITHVIRGEEWLSSTPKHILLYRFFGWETPVFAHLPLLLNPDKSKLSKRQGDVAVEEYRQKGYLAEALLNFVAFLGWNPGDEREIFTLEELIQEFSLERVGKSGAVFNVEKLNWLNSQHVRRMSEGEIEKAVRAYGGGCNPPVRLPEQVTLQKIVRVMRDRVTFMGDFIEKCRYLYEPPESYDPEGVSKRWKPGTSDLMKTLAEAIAAVPESSNEAFEEALKKSAAALEVKPADLIHPLRLAVSGVTAGPGLYDILSILGKDESARRILAAIKRLPQ